MRGAVLLVPFFLVRFGLLYALDRGAIGRAAHFPPMAGLEKVAYALYQIATAGLVVGLFFLRIKGAPTPLFVAGLAVYAAGMLLLTLSVLGFAAPSKSGVRSSGLYRFSRNPMYVAYFVCFMGCALLTQSPVLFGCALAMQGAGHWIILAEERWCSATFGEEYRRYLSAVRRYL